MKNGILHRHTCSLCRSGSGRVIYECDYERDPVRKYVEKFYSSQGRGADISRLSGVVFCLVECDRCELLYQKFVPIDDLAYEIYEKWIDPDVVIERRKISDGIDHYSEIASEVMALIKVFDAPPSNLKFLDFGKKEISFYFSILVRI